MRTRRSVGADDAQCPTLKLVMEKGPLSGQTHAYRPGACARLGRIARGNTLAIKDAGVSSKHLLIEVAPASELGLRHWTVSDLESSNGTFLNCELLKPFAPEVLSDGDIILIGEQTSIRVQLEVGGDECKVSERSLRRNRRRGKAAVGELGAVDEDTELGLGDKHLRNGVDLGAGLVDKKPEEVAVEIEGKKPRTRGRKKKEAPEEVPKKEGEPSRKDKINDEEKDGPEVAVDDLNFERKGAAESTISSGVKDSKPGGGVKNVVVDLDKMAVEIESKKPRRGRKKKEAPVEVPEKKGEPSPADKINDEENGEPEVAVDGLNFEQKGAAESTSSSGVKDGKPGGGIKNVVVDLDKMAVEIEGMKPRRGRSEKEAPVEVPESEGEPSSKDKINDEEKGEPKVAVDDLNFERKGVVESTSSSGVKDGKPGSGIKNVVVDLDKMTMCEWFDYLEVSLPQQIIDETEEAIAEMRQKAERLHEFMQQQKKELTNMVKMLFNKLWVCWIYIGMIQSVGRNNDERRWKMQSNTLLDSSRLLRGCRLLSQALWEKKKCSKGCKGFLFFGGVLLTDGVDGLGGAGVVYLGCCRQRSIQVGWEFC